MNDFFLDFRDALNFFIKQPKDNIYLCIIMFKTMTCPPCKQTIAILEQKDQNNKNVFQLSKSTFMNKIEYTLGNSNMISVFKEKTDLIFSCFDQCAIDSIERDHLQYFQKIASTRIQGYPTFVPFFFYNNEFKELPMRHLGGLPGAGFLSMYLNNNFNGSTLSSEYIKLFKEKLYK